MLDEQPLRTIEWALTEFDHFNGKYKRDAVECALTHQEEILPKLLAILEAVVAHPEDFLPPDDDHDLSTNAECSCIEGHNTWSHIYAVTLLSHFREKRAHKLIAKLFSLPEPICDALWGDMVTEDLPALLYSTYPGSPETIKKIVLDKSLDDFVRISAADALACCVAGGLLDRDEVLKFLIGLFTGNEADGYSDFWSHLACTVLDLHPIEYAETIRKAFTEGLIAEGVISRKWFEHELQKYSVETSMAKLNREIDRRLPSNIHKRLEWWASFHEQKEKDEDKEFFNPFLASMPVRMEPKIGLNDPCPCESGKKFKKCCLQ